MAENVFERGVTLICGLGNPGIEYQFTPHNAGFLAIDRIAGRSNAVVSNRRSRALTARTTVQGKPVVLAKPETYMNLSGLAVRALLNDLESANLIVLYDELDLPLGTMRIRERGSSGGHNGAKSISSALGTEEWLRIRIGVGPAAGMARDRDYLLSPMKKVVLAEMDEVLDRVADAVEMILRDGVSAAMNEFNRKEDL